MVAIGVRCSHLAIIMASISIVDLVRYKVLDFFLALQRLVVLFFKVNFLMQKLIVEANDAPPENVVCHFVELFCQLVQDS